MNYSSYSTGPRRQRQTVIPLQTGATPEKIVDEYWKNVYNVAMEKTKEPVEMFSSGQTGIRINKYLSDAGYCSRREADRLVSEGRVTVDGRKAAMGEKIQPYQKVEVDHQSVTPGDSRILLLFNKPRGIVCSTKKQRSEKIVTEYIDFPQRIYPVGRLDKESEGLLLLTNEGELMNRILKSSNYHEKEYIVKVDRPVTEKFLQKMRSGVPILDTVTRPCTVERTGKDSFSIILTQGLNRQIRRMCQALGYEVVFLKRIRICNLTLDGLKTGEYRKIEPGEYKELERYLERNRKNSGLGDV